MPEKKDSPKKMGRPALPPGEKAVVGTIRLTPARWEKLRLLGAAWLGKVIDKAKLPAKE